MAASLEELKRTYFGAALNILEPTLSGTSLAELEQAFFSQSPGTLVASVIPVTNVSALLSTTNDATSAAANVSAINTAITNVNTAGGGTVAIVTPGTYYINDHILMKSNVRLWVDRGVTIKKLASTTNNVCMLRNANPLGAAPFTDTNMVIEGGGALDGNYAGNSATLVGADTSAPASNTLLYGVQGELALIGVQGLVIRNIAVNNGNGFGIQMLGQNLLVENVAFSTARDGIHLNGPSQHVTLRNCYGKTDDDFIAINAWDWHRSGPSVGDITDVTIDRCTYLGTSGLRGIQGAGVKMLPGTRSTGAGAGTGNLRNINILGLHVEGAKALSVLSDYDQVASEYSGTGTVEGVTVAGGYFVPDASSNAAVLLWKGPGGTAADGQTSLTIRNMVIEDCYFDLATNGAANGINISYAVTTLAIQGFVARDNSWKPKSSAGSQFLNVQSKSILDSIELDGLSFLAAGGASQYPAAMVNTYNGSAASEVKSLGVHRIQTAPGLSVDTPVVVLNGVVDQMNARDWAMTFTGGSSDNHGIYFSNSVALLKRAVLSGLDLTNPKELFRIGNGATGSVICKAIVRDSNLVGCTHPVFISGSHQADITFRGGNIDTGNNLARVDTSTLTLTLDGTTSTGAGATTITQVSTTTLRIPKCDRIALNLGSLTTTPSDGDQVYSSATPSSVVSGTGAGVYIYRSATGWVKLN